MICNFATHLKKCNRFVSCLGRNLEAFYCGGHLADKIKTKKAVTYSIYEWLLLIFCTPVEIKKVQYRAMLCNDKADKTLLARCLLIALYRKKFISGGQMADTE